MFYLLSGHMPFGDGETNLRKIQNAIITKEAPDLRDIMGLHTVSDREVTRVGDKVAEVVAKALCKEPDERFQSAAEMLEALGSAMVRRGYSLYDAMISYRVQSEAKLALALFERLSREQIQVAGGGTRRMRVYLDKFRLENGERWDEGFVLDGVASSTVVIPLCSEGVMGLNRGFAALGVKVRLDCLLLEWELILDLHKAGRIAKVFPLLVGKLQDDGTRTDFFDDGSHFGDQVPNAHSPLTFAETAKFLTQIDPSLSPEPQPVRTVRDTILRFHGSVHNLATHGTTHGSDKTSRAELEEKTIEACVQQAVSASSAVRSWLRARTSPSPRRRNRLWSCQPLLLHGPGR